MATKAFLEQAYLAYFGRPIDPNGVAAFVNATETEVENAFWASPESQALYGSVFGLQQINMVYNMLFGRDAEPAGLAYWANQIVIGALTPAGAAIGILRGALNDDVIALNNKLAASAAFTAGLDTTDEILGYAGDQSAAVARAFLQSITMTPATQAEVDAAIVAAVAVGNVTGGQTFTLTTGADAIVGTPGNDIINALSVNAAGTNATTFSAFDSINGGAGTDTLNIFTNNGTGLNASFPASGTVANVEIVNIFNANGAAALGDASKYVGVTQLWQHNAAAAVTKLAATTTAGFKDLAAAQVLSVQAADAAAAAAVAFRNVAEASTLNVAATAAGTLATVNVSGTVTDTNVDGVIGNTAINVTAGKDVQSVVVNTGVATTLTVTNTGTKAVNAVDLSGSAGGVTYAAAATVATISGGAGKDTLTNSFAGTAAANAAALTGGAGDDVLNLNATLGAASAVTASVDAGEGNDKVNLTINTGVTLTVTGGAGDDSVAVTGGVVKTTDKISGGEGTDSISLATNAALIADDYIVFNKVLTDFETLKITNAVNNLDASKLAANYTTLDLATGSTVDNVGTQSLIANGNLVAEAAGFVKVGEGAPPATSITYAGTLNITDVATGFIWDTITARAETVNLTVKGDTGNAVGQNLSYLVGEAKSANVTLSAGTDTKGTTSTADDTFVTSYFDVDTVALGQMKDLANLTITGNGFAYVFNGAGTKLANVDASGLNSVNELGVATQAVYYYSSNEIAETVKLGGGLDQVLLNLSTYGKMDTVTGLNLVLNAAGTALDATKTDTLVLGNGWLDLQAAGKFTTTQTDLDLALKDAAASAVNTLAFQMSGNTYLFQDVGTVGLVDAADIVVKLTGTIDLDTLVIAV